MLTYFPTSTVHEPFFIPTHESDSDPEVWPSSGILDGAHPIDELFLVVSTSTVACYLSRGKHVDKSEGMVLFIIAFLGFCRLKIVFKKAFI